MSARIGVFGGTFDPIHIGHLVAASEAHTALQLDQVIFMPAGQPWQKSHIPVTSAEERFAMVECAVDGDHRFVASNLEIKRSGPTYAIDTVRELKQLYPDATFTWIVGADVLSSLTTWHEWESFICEVEIAAVNRAGVTADSVPFDYTAVEMPDIRVSATQLRERLTKGISCKYLIPNAVLDLIEARQLFQDELR